MNNTKINKQLLFSLALAGFVAGLNAQGIVNEGAKIVVAGSTNLIVSNGGFLNSNSGTVDNDGTIKVDGNWTNNASNAVFANANGTGLVELNGSSAQTIGGSNPTTFENLTVSGSGIKSMGVSGNTIGAVLTLDGTVDLNGYTLIIDNPSTSAILQNSPATTKNIRSESTNASGKLQWNVGTNTGSYVYPFGTAASESIPFTFNITTAGIGSGNVSVATYPTGSNNLPKPPTMPNPSLSDHLNFEGTGANTGNGSSATVDRWWQIDANSYTTKPVSSMTFKYTDTDLNPSGNVLLTEANLKAQRFNTSTTQWNPPNFFAGSSNTASAASNSVTVTNVTDYSPWTLHDGTSTGNTPLPITLLSYNAVCNGDGKVTVNWATASEVNNDFFEVQRSVDGTNYATIAVIDGAGSSNTVVQYSYVDNTPNASGTYYRLNQVDFNGANESFTPDYANCATNVANSSVGIYPNPADQQVNVSINLASRDQGAVVVYNSVGQLISNEYHVFDKGMTVLPVSINNLAQGQYFIQIKLQNTQLPVQKLVVSR